MPCNWSFLARNVAHSIRPHPARFLATEIAPAALTEAQMSRATSRAIHQCLQLQSLPDAYYILNSLRYSNFQHQKSRFKLTGVRSLDNFASAAIQFGRPVSPRLSSHALLHGLLRIGLTKKAYKLTRLMINDGIKVRSKTLEAVMMGFYPQTPPTFTPARPVHAVPNLRVAMAHDEGTRMALSLLMLAQKSWQRRTRSMYKTLLALCLLNGELILGSLLFGSMIRHWQSQMALDSTTTQPVPNADDGDIQPETKPYAPSRLRERLQPSAAMLQSLLVGIKTNLEHAGESEESPGSVQAALQALAVLANLLDQHELPMADLSFLIHTLYNTPKLDHQVWVTEKGRRKQKKAYDYFHRVLERFIHNLPSRSYPTCRPGQPVTPAPDLPAYNALLHYALRYRSSPDLGNRILNHMVNERRPSLKPDITTYNTIVRSGTIMRDSKIVEQALLVLRRNVRNHLLVSVVADEPTRDRSLSVNRTAKTTVQKRDAAWTKNIRVQDVPEMDSTTLCSYITYLTAIGQPHKAATLFSLLIPELRMRRSRLPTDDRIAIQEAYLKKTVELGPHVFTALLSALHKAGRCGLAERVWLVALTAERASHDPAYGCRQPWTLPVHAYTVMMQCYGAQIRNHRPVIGWARLLSPNERPAGLQRRMAARRLARITYEHAKSRLHGGTPTSRLDARFFNAALSVFARHPETGRLVAARRQAYRRHWERSQLEYAQFGRQSRFSHPMMRETGQDILDAGYRIPAAYRHMLIGHISPVYLQWQPVRASALSIPTVKRTGLPVRRRFRPRTRHRRSSYLSCKSL